MEQAFQFNEINDRFGARQSAMTTSIHSRQADHPLLGTITAPPLRRSSRYLLTPTLLCPIRDCIRYRFGATAIYLISLNHSDA